MDPLDATWAVTYADGATLVEGRDPDSVPLAAIDWPRVTRVAFESGRARTELAVDAPPPGATRRLIARVFGDALSGRTLRAFCVLTGRPGADPAAVLADPAHLVFWLPDGSVGEVEGLWSVAAAVRAAELLGDPAPAPEGAWPS